LTGGVCFETAQGEHVFFFDIDVKVGEKSLGGDSECMWVLVRVQMHVGYCVSINAKGGECWKIFNRQRMLVYLSLMASTIVKMA
jgi:hypothetical protein